MLPQYSEIDLQGSVSEPFSYTSLFYIWYEGPNAETLLPILGTSYMYQFNHTSLSETFKFVLHVYLFESVYHCKQGSK
jgi:hypothetical protein